MTLAQMPPNQAAHTNRLRGRVTVLGGLSIALIAASYIMPTDAGVILSLGVGSTFGMLAVLMLVMRKTERKKVASNVQSIENVIKNDPAPSVVTDHVGTLVHCNKAAVALLNCQVGLPFAEHLKDKFANPGAAVYRLQNKATSLGGGEEDIATRRGHVRLSVNRVSDGCFVWRIEDLGERSIRSSNAETLSIPMLTASKSGTVLFMNESCRRILGGRPKTIEAVFETLPVRNGAINTLTTASGALDSLVSEIAGIGGRREIYLLPGLASGLTEVSDWTFFDELPIPLIKISKAGIVTSANREARKIISLDMTEPAPLSDLLDGLGRSIADWIEDAFNARLGNKTEVLRVKSDEDQFLQVTLNLMMQDGVPSLVAILTDATELKSLEAQFVQSQKMQAIGQLAGGVAHDFNNLLTAISGHCDLLLLRHDQGDPDYGDLVQINQNANRAASLVGQLLAFSRKQNLRPEILDMRDTLSDLSHLLNRLVGEKIMLSVTHDPDLFPIRADKRQLEQVVMNLVVNARDAMPEGGSIRIETESRTLRAPLERDRAIVEVGDYVVVRVTDQGCGIPQEQIAKIFEPFYTTKRTGEGTGLGLSTAYGIVKQTGGFIFVDSVEGQGTEFSLYLPANNTPLEEVVVEAAPVAKPTIQQAEGVVLLVEDEAPVRAFASRALRMRGYTVMEAENGEMALEILDDEGLSVDLFVTDVIMPGMDGPTWVKQALVKRPDVKVVFVSGYAEEDFSDNQAKIQNSVFLPKPFSLNDLTATVQAQLQ